MSHAPDELRRLAETRVARAREPNPATGPIAAISLFGGGWMLMVPVAIAVALKTGPPRGPDDSDVLLLVAGGLPAVAFAAAAAITALLRWRSISGLWRALAFVPWLVSSLGGLIVVFEMFD